MNEVEPIPQLVDESGVDIATDVQRLGHDAARALPLSDDLNDVLARVFRHPRASQE